MNDVIRPVGVKLGVTVIALWLAFAGVTFASAVEVTDWTSVVGQWEVQIVNKDAANANTNAYAEVVQEGSVISYEWTVQFGTTTFSLGPAAGMHIMADQATDGARGNSYLVFQDGEFIRLYKSSFGSLSKVTEFPAVVQTNETHTYAVDFHTDTGVLTIQRNGEHIGEWTDASPLTSGQYISLRTNGTNAVFSGVQVTAKD